MSWRSDAKRAIAMYPSLAQKESALRTVRITPNYNGMPSCGGESRTTENIALLELAPAEQKMLDAVRSAISVTRKYSNADLRIKAIELLYWRKGNTSFSVACKVHISKATMDAWNTSFVQLVDAFLTR